MKRCGRKFCVKERGLAIGLTVAAVLVVQVVWADPDGEAGLTKANDMLRGYFKYGADILYAIGGLVGLIGSIRVYNKFSHSEPDTTKVATNWFAACIFLVLVATIIKSFFGIA